MTASTTGRYVFDTAADAERRRLEAQRPDGLVAATDIETRGLEPLTSSNLVVRHHNVR